MKTHFQFFEDEKLFIIKYVGKFSFDKYVEQVHKFTKREEWLFVENILVDIRNTDFNMPLDKIDELVDVKENNDKTKEVNTVHLVASPPETVVVHLYQEPLKAKKYKMNYCTTLEKAKELLRFSNSPENLDHRINQLKYTD